MCFPFFFFDSCDWLRLASPFDFLKRVFFIPRFTPSHRRGMREVVGVGEEVYLSSHLPVITFSAIDNDNLCLERFPSRFLQVFRAYRLLQFASVIRGNQICTPKNVLKIHLCSRSIMVIVLFGIIII